MVNVSDIGGTVINLLVFAALYPLMDFTLEILLPQLGQTESMIVSSIPLILGILIAVDAFQSEPETQLRGR